jgi:mannose-6-phosphate isomerase-like protein (cupin superfamily)
MMRNAIPLLMGVLQMAQGQSAVSKSNAEHYTWGEGCDGWYLVRNDDMTIIEERMPPGTEETLHKHARSRQFFFVLAGSAVMEHGDAVTVLTAGSGLEIPPGVAHRILNKSGSDLEILVTSRPPSHADRVEINSPARKIGSCGELCFFCPRAGPVKPMGLHVEEC